MPTTKKRVNISLAPDLERALSRIAKRDNMKEATKAGELLRLALEIEEDVALATIATHRQNTQKKTLSHTQVWK
jgi:predicted DNA-binding protein